MPVYSQFDDATDSLKIPPHSIEAEQSVLGGLMFNNAAWIEIADILVEDDFYRSEHRLIFSAIKSLSEASHPCDVVTLLEWLEEHARLEAIGGRAYLGQLHKNTPSAANILAYAKIVRERAILRQLIQVGTKITESAFNAQGRDVKVLLDEAERTIFNIAEQGARGQGGFIELKEALAEALERIDGLFGRESAVTGLATGFIDFDLKTSGLQQSDLIIVAGRPSMGKTSFAMNVAEHAVIHEKLPVAVFSMEMSSEQLAMRLLASVARVDLQKVRTARLNDDDWNSITKAIGVLSEAPLFIDDTAALSPTEMGARIRRLAREQGHLGLIIIDYIQLMHVPNTRENRVAEVSEISRSLKALAKELSVPVMALSQLNRGLEQRPDKRPRMADLRESGCLVGDSLIICADTGQGIPIRDLVGRTDFHVWGLNTQTMRLERAWVSRAFYSGIKKVFQLMLSSKRGISATANHKFYTPEGWRRLDELQAGDYLAVPRCIQLPPVEVADFSKSLKDVFWDKVTHITAVSEEEVYDLTVPSVHNFIANNIIASNSLEQDADLIAFIYRDEVYNEDSLDKGIAEVIIGKQRNGPIGTIRLTFLNHITKFENHEDEDTYSHYIAPQEQEVVLSHPLRFSPFSKEGKE
jgi:replicative DNA helicase